MPYSYVNWRDAVLRGIYVRQVLASYALLLNGATKIQPTNSKTIRMFVMNNSLTPVYVGADASVHASNGFPLLPYDVMVFQFIPEIVSMSVYLYGEGQEVRVLEVW
jgi:ribosomal protein S19